MIFIFLPFFHLFTYNIPNNIFLANTLLDISRALRTDSFLGG